MTSYKSIITENKLLKDKINELEERLRNLDRQIFYLKAFSDIKQEIAPFSKSVKEIVKAFLMMIMGTFGIFNGFLVLVDREDKKVDCYESRSFEKDYFKSIIVFFQQNKWNIFLNEKPLTFFDQNPNSQDLLISEEDKKAFNMLVSKGINNFVYFYINRKFCGAIALGKRINGEPFSMIDREVLYALIDQLVINIVNTKSFSIIKELNEDLKNKSKILEETYRKIQLLENAKTLLCKFIPKSLEKIIEAQPESPDLDKKDIDISILFLDIEGYTNIIEKLEYEEITQLIETYFSYFLDDIFHYEGDINMNLGDGLMIIFQDKNQNKHALNATKTALAIRDKTKIINEKMKGFIEPFSLNIGIHSGLACVGINRLDSYFGSRWTYTAIGPTVNIASRISSFAKNGDILVSYNTLSRIKDNICFEYLGPQYFKNLKDEIKIYRILH